MANKINQIVQVDTIDATSSVATSSVNTVAICVVGSGSAESFNNLDDIAEKFGKESTAYEMAEVFFSQQTHPNELVIIPCASATSANVISAIEAANGFDFYHVVLGLEIGSGENAAKEVIDFVKALNTKANLLFKMFHVEVGLNGNYDLLKNVYEGYTSGEEVIVGLEESETKRVALWTNEEHLGVAIVAQRCGVDPARGTWCHKKGLVGVTPSAMSVGEFGKAKTYGFNVYTNVAGENRVFFGTTCGPKDFIDTIIKMDWIKFNTESAIYAMLGEANDGYGLTYDNTGIQAIGAVVSKVLTTANNNQYIMNGFSVSTPTIATIARAQKDVRNVPDIKGYYSIMDSVHTVLNVQLNVVYPTEG